MKPMTGRDLAIAAAALFAVVTVTGATSVVRAQQRQPVSEEEAGGLEVLQLRPNFYMIAGAGGNIAVQTGPDGVVVVDAGSAAKADAVLAAIRKRADRPIRYVIDTSADADHVGGNEPLSKAGETLFNLNSAIATAMTNGGAATILSAEKVLVRMSAPAGAAVGVSSGGMADRDLPSTAAVHVHQRRGDRGPASARRAHAMATAWCSSADPMSWSPAMCSTPPAFR